MALSVPAKYRKYVWIVAGLLLLYILSRIWAAIPTYDSTKMGKYAAAKSQYAKLKIELTAKNDALVADNAAKDKLLAAKQADIDRKNVIVAGLSKKQSDLEAQFVLIKDCPGQVLNLTVQVSGLKDTVKVQEGIISDNEDKIQILTIQKRNALQGWANTGALLQASEDKAAACDAVQKQLARDLKISKLTGTIKTGLILGVAAYIGYSLLRGK